MRSPLERVRVPKVLISKSMWAVLKSGRAYNTGQTPAKQAARTMGCRHRWERAAGVGPANSGMTAMAIGLSGSRRDLKNFLSRMSIMSLASRMSPRRRPTISAMRQLQTVFGRDSIRSLGGRLEVEHATLGVEQINDRLDLHSSDFTLTGCSIVRGCTGAAASDQLIAPCSVGDYRRPFLAESFA